MKRFIECLIPVTVCNLKCSYCYVMQQERFLQKITEFKYDPDLIGRALSIKRLGGLSFISMTGSGESLIPKEAPAIIKNVLQQGHFVNLTTNGTLTYRFEEIINFPKEYLERLHLSFSMHYLELKRVGKIDEFFNNIDIIRKAGCSFFVQVNMSDEYMPIWDNIKSKVVEKTGALPQVASTRDESEKPKRYKVFTKKPEHEYISISREANSPLFEFTLSNFMKKRKEFCYAGDWSGKLNLGTGILSGCYGFGIKQNIFEDINKPIRFEAIGRNCPFLYCFNSSHFLSLGTIPSIWKHSYGELRNRENVGWYSQKMKSFLNERLFDNNDEYSLCKKIYVNIKYSFLKIYKILSKIIIKVLKIIQNIIK